MDALTRLIAELDGSIIQLDSALDVLARFRSVDPDGLTRVFAVLESNKETLYVIRGRIRLMGSNLRSPDQMTFGDDDDPEPLVSYVRGLVGEQIARMPMHSWAQAPAKIPGRDAGADGQPSPDQ